MLESLDYYDWLVAAIPVIVALGAAASLHPSVALYQGLAAGSTGATVVVYEMLFRNPPVERTFVDRGAVALWGVVWMVSLVLYL